MTTEIDRVAVEVFTLEVNHHLDMGRPIDEVRAVIESEHPGHGWVIDGYVEHFRHSLGPVIAGTAKLIEELVDDGVRCLGLSNWSALCFAGIPEAYPILAALDDIVISGDLGICKPDPAIFHHVEERFGLAPGQIVFLDDSVANVDAAAALGWDAVLFTDPEDARRALVERGILDRTAV